MKRILLAMGICAAAWSGCAKQKVAAKSTPLVRAAVVEMGTDASETRYSGVVAPDTQVDVAFRVSGYVASVGRLGGRELQEGDAVAAGTVLARLRPVEYEKRSAYAGAAEDDATAVMAAQQAQLADAEAAVRQAERDYRRASGLFAEKAMTRAEFESVQTRRESALARKGTAEAQIAAQKARMAGAKAQRGEAEVTLGDTALVAPFAGVIVAKKIAKGSFASPGAPVFTIADVRVAKVSFGVPDTALRSFRLGQTLDVSTEAAPDKALRGRVQMIAPAADAASRVFPVQVAIGNGDGTLQMGMVVTVSVRTEGVQAPMAPLAAVVQSAREAQGFGVYVIDRDGGVDRARLRTVRLGAVRGNAVIVTEGLRGGERIVASGGLQLTDGEIVRVMQ